MIFCFSDYENIIQGHNDINNFLGVRGSNSPKPRKIIVNCIQKPLICLHILFKERIFSKDLEHRRVLKSIAEGDQLFSSV